MNTAVQNSDFRMSDRHLQTRRQQPFRGRKNDLIAVLDGRLDHVLCPFIPVIGIKKSKIGHRLYFIFEHLFQVHAPKFMAVRPAGISHRFIMDKGDIQLFNAGSSEKACENVRRRLILPGFHHQRALRLFLQNRYFVPDGIDLLFQL